MRRILIYNPLQRVSKYGTEDLNMTFSAAICGKLQMYLKFYCNYLNFLLYTPASHAL